MRSWKNPCPTSKRPSNIRKVITRHSSWNLKTWKKPCTILVVTYFWKEVGSGHHRESRVVERCTSRRTEEKKQADPGRTNEISQRNCLNQIQTLRKTEATYIKVKAGEANKQTPCGYIAVDYKKEREQKYALHNQVVVVRDADEVNVMMRGTLNNANRCLTPGSAIGELGDWEMLSSMRSDQIKCKMAVVSKQ